MNEDALMGALAGLFALIFVGAWGMQHWFALLLHFALQLLPL